MNILQYVSKLIPSFGRDHVLDELTRLNSAVTGTLLPSLKQAQKAFHGHPVASGPAKQLEGALRNQFRTLSHASLFDILVKIFDDVPAQLDVLEKYIEENFSKDQTKEAITYRRATALQYLETLNFAVEYATRSVLRIIAAEAAMAASEADRVDQQLTTREKAEFLANQDQWLKAMQVISQDSDLLLSAIEQVPDAVVSEQHDAAVVAAAGARSIDPLKMNFLAPRNNLFFHIGMAKAEWEVAQVQRAKEEKQLVELRLLELNNARSGSPNPRLERQIELVNDRLTKLNFRIRKLSGEI